MSSYNKLKDDSNNLYIATPSYNPLEGGVVEYLDSFIVDKLPWKEDSYFKFNQTKEEKEYIDKLSM